MGSSASGEIVEQAAIVRLADGRWAALTYFAFSKTQPYVRGVAVAASSERLWRFALGDEERRWLAPRLPSTPPSSTEQRLLSALRENPDDAEALAAYDLAGAQDAPRGPDDGRRPGLWARVRGWFK